MSDISADESTFGWIAIKLGLDIHVFQKINWNNFGGPLTFPVAPSSGQNFNVSNSRKIPIIHHFVID